MSLSALTVAGRPGRLTRLAQGEAGTPRISGDGKVVVWNQATEKGPEIMRFQNGRVEALTDNVLGDIHATPSFDGSTIVWERFSHEDINNKDGRWQVVRWRDGQETLLTNDTGNCQDPTVSANGKVVAWLNDISGTYKESVAQAFDEATGKAENLSASSDYAFAPSVSADGSKIAFRKNTGKGPEIFLKDGEAAPKPVTFTPFEAEDSVRLTADGKSVFFSAVGIDGTDNIFKVDLATGKRSVVSAEFKADEVWLSPSADGSVVAWTNFDRSQGDVDVQIKQKDRQGKTAILTEGTRYHAHPHMSADGKALVFMEVNPKDTKDVGIYLWQADDVPAAPALAG